jgi:hypothetical protein
MSEDQTFPRLITKMSAALALYMVYPEIRRVERFLVGLKFTGEISEGRKLLVIYLLEQMV